MCGTRRASPHRMMVPSWVISPMPSRPIAIGCMRLSTDPDRDDAKSIAVLHSAFDAGVSLLDTADAYCWNDSEVGHNERLIARALSTWSGDRSRITVATKGGLTRPDGRWEADGRAKHLTAACERSCEALGVQQLDLYQLHVVDPQIPLLTSARALAALKRRGLVKAVGLCNVTVGQIEEARRVVDIDAIQVEASVWHDAAFLSGVVDYCIERRMRLLAYRPLGGRKSRPRTQADPTLAEIANRHGVTPFEIATAWLADLSDLIVPLPGVTRVETARSAARAQQLVLTDADRERLDARFPCGRALRLGERQRPPSALKREGEVVLVMGLPGAGKSTLSKQLVGEGYQRINRDEAGGTLRELLPVIGRAVDAGQSRIVLDNTYISRRSRAEVVRAAHERGLEVRCIWLATSVDDAQVNAAARLISRYGKLPGDAELSALRKRDPAAFLPTVQFRYQRELEPPDVAEGFSRVDVVRFERRHDLAHVNRAVIVWCDEVLVRSRDGHRQPSDPEDVVIVDATARALLRYQDEGVRILGMSWQPEVAARDRSDADVAAVFARVRELTGLTIHVEYCPHAAGPPRCWCRKPLPGLGAFFVHRYQLDPARCVYIGAGSQDPGFARKLGFTYLDASDLRQV